MIDSAGTTRPPATSSMASTVRGWVPPTSTGAPSRATSRLPSNRNSNDSLLPCPPRDDETVVPRQRVRLRNHSRNASATCEVSGLPRVSLWNHARMATTAPPAASATVDDLALIDAWWRAANYLSVGQIYLLDNPLLREPLTLDHVKPRLLGHWGTTPGLNLLYAHLNRCIRTRDLDMIYVCGPGHGGPDMVANTYMEGTYNELYPEIGEDLDGMRKLFR